MRIFLAPMEGVVDHHMRHLLTRLGGIDLCVTEFVRVTDHVLPERVFKRYCPELVGHPRAAVCPTRIQLLGSNASALAANARKAARMGAVGIDLNFGCPAKTVNRHRGGACLLTEPDTLFDIVSQVRAAVPADIPVSAKIRLGYEDRQGYLENAAALCAAGADEIVIHARSKADGYKPPAYWDLIGEIRQHIPTPIVANGEIWSVDNYIRCAEQSRCSDVMLGRGLLARPDLALAIKAHVSGETYTPLPWHQIATLLLEFFEDTTPAYPAKFLGNRSKQWLFYLQRHYPQAKCLFDRIKRSRDCDELRFAITAETQQSTLQRQQNSTPVNTEFSVGASGQKSSAHG